MFILINCEKLCTKFSNIRYGYLQFNSFELQNILLSFTILTKVFNIFIPKAYTIL